MNLYKMHIEYQPPVKLKFVPTCAHRLKCCVQTDVPLVIYLE